MTVVTRRPLGDLLVAAGLISADDARQALVLQRQSGKRLGEVLTNLGLVTEEDVARTLAAQLRLPFLPESDLQPDLGAVRLLPLSMARAKGMLPLRVLDDRALVATCDPLDVVSLDDVRRHLRRDIDLVVVTPRAVERAVRQCEGLINLSGKSAAAGPGQPAGDSDAPIVRLVDDLMVRALEEGASDIHLEPTEGHVQVRLRIDGLLHEVLRSPLSHQQALVARVKVMAGLDITERRLPQDGRVEYREGNHNLDIRVSTFPTVFGEKVVLRLFDRGRALRSLPDLGMEAGVLAAINQAIHRSHGMILVTGPTGSGKTSTLLSALSSLVSPSRNIVTIEDPVEYLVPGVNHSQINPKAGLNFASGLRSILRQDPDIIMVGEIRDSETADVAVRAALTGHLVISTLHTGDAAEALTRLADMGVEPFLIASAVLGVLAQRLIRVLCPRCRRQRLADGGLFDRHGVALSGDATQFESGACTRCRQTGFTGRTPIFEYLSVTPAVQALVQRHATTAEIRAQARADGMVPITLAGLQKVLAGETTAEEVFRVVDTPV